MEPEPKKAASKKPIWIGRVLSAVPALMLIFSAMMKFVQPKGFAEGMAHLGYPERLAIWLGIVEVACTILYVIPRTSVLGAILLTGYLGGAIATHLRVGDPVYTVIALGIVVWAGLFLREARLRALIPLRRRG